MSSVQLLRQGRAAVLPSALEALPHILLVVDQLPRALGGGERIVLKMAEQLPEYGYRASILTFDAHPDSAALVNPPCPVYLLRLTRTWNLNALLAAFSLRRFLRKQRIALVHTCFESSDIWAGGVTRLLSHAKLVWNRRDMGILRSPKHHAAYRRMARLPHAVFAVSEQVRRYSVESDGIAPERVITVPNGIDLARWPEIERSASIATPVIVTLGNLRRVKGQDVLLRAFAVVQQEFPRAKLILGGAVLEPEFSAELRATAQELGIAESVQFAGNITDQQTFLGGATVFVLPSRSEGFSNAIIEAMAASLPVVATNVGGNAEAVTDGLTGFIVPPDHPDALAAATLALLRAPETARAMGYAGRQRVMQQFTTEAMMRRVAGTFDRLLQLPGL